MNTTQVILQAKYDYSIISQHSPTRPLLCATFIKASLSPFPVLYSNIVHFAGVCDWAIVLYDADSDTHVNKICESVNISG